MPSLDQEFREFVLNRIDNAFQNIKDDEKFKNIRMECLRLQEQIIESLPSGQRDTFIQFCELTLQREAVLEDQIYKTGFADGSHIVRMLSESV